MLLDSRISLYKWAFAAAGNQCYNFFEMLKQEIF